jgi:NDP-sugar pyrophosphorylase family protein
MKALILAAGRGRRLGNVSGGINKCMVEVAGKPLLEYSLYCAASLSQIEEIIIVVGYRKEAIIERYGKEYNGRDTICVTQKEQHGLVHAIESAREALGLSDFMLMLGDEFMINPYHKDFIETFKMQDVFALCGIVAVGDRNLIKNTYAAVGLDDGRIVRLIEKPNNPIFNNMMGTGNCIFKNQILDYIPLTPINQNRQEKELPDLIQCAIDDGRIVKSFIICKEYVNVNSPEELDKTNSYFSHP